VQGDEDGYGPVPASALLAGYRRRAGLTQAELAKLAGLSVAGLRDIEQGRVSTPRAGTLRRLAAVLGLSSAEAGDLAHRPVPEAVSGQEAWIGVLGPLTVRVGGTEVDPGSEVQRMLLGLLALSPNLPVAKDRLLPRLAAAGRPATDGGLAARMSRLRRRLRPATGNRTGPSLVAADGGYALLVAPDQLDLLAFQALVRQARRQLGAGELREAWERYAEAAALWRGEPLAGVASLAGDPAVVSLLRHWKSVAAEFAEVGAEVGRYEEVVPVLRRLAAADPLHQVVHARLMVALAGAGQQAEALATFDTLRRRLDRDLHTVPGPALVDAHRRVLRQELTRPPVAAVGAVRTLPPDPAGFVGREAQLRRLMALVAAQATVVTIEGMPGVGKTRLALHFAHRLVARGHYSDQQLYTDLSGGADPADVLAEWLGLLGVPAGQIPADLAERTDRYRERLRGRSCLVLLDSAVSADQVAPLLPGIPGSLTVLTSRRDLRLPDSQRVELDLLAPGEQVALFGAVAGRDRVEAEPTAASRVLEACAGLPLAITLAGRRLQARPGWRVADLARRLSEPDQRLEELRAGDRSVQATLAQSHRELPPDLRGPLRRLGREPRPELTPEVAAARLGTDRVAAHRVLDRLRREHLVARSGPDRYRLHSLVRDYLREATG
jgi:DNA-binding SARP family transcriptional activator/DNA-binding XRE family transcriptional regulator